MRIIIVSIFFLEFFLQFKSYGQQVEKGFELVELMKIAETYKNIDNLSFSINYTYADSARPTTYLEQLSGTSKLSNGKYWSLLDSIEYLQGYQYNLTVYYSDSTVVVADKQEYGNMMKAPILDSAYTLNFVDSLKINEFDDSTRLVSVFFKTGTPYVRYKLYYDKYQFLIRKMEFYAKNIPYDS